MIITYIIALLLPANAQFWSKSVVDKSLNYAQAQVNRYLSSVTKNIKTLPTKGIFAKVPTIDLLWPGNGYDQSAYAGNYAVLKILEKKGILKVGKIMGASGGATAALLALASESKGKEAARLMLESFEAQSDMWGTVAELRKEYLKRISSPITGLFMKGTITKDLYVALMNKYGQYTVVYNLQGPKQASAAVLGSGGTHYTEVIPGVKCLGGTYDGGIMSAFGKLKKNLNPTLYYAAWYGNALSCKRDCIATNFKSGVDFTLKLLMSSEFAVPVKKCSIFSSCSGMIMSTSGTGQDLQRMAKKYLRGGSPLRTEPSASAPKVWADAATYCGFFGRRRVVPFAPALVDASKAEQSDVEEEGDEENIE